MGIAVSRKRRREYTQSMIRMDVLRSRVVLLVASLIVTAIGLSLYFKDTILAVACNSSGTLAEAGTCERQSDDGQIYFASCSGFF